MKPIHLMFFMILGLLTACDQDNVNPQSVNSGNSIYRPVLMDKDQLKNSVSFEAARDLSNPGKIYYKDNYIFISDRYKGVHVIDNSNPASPVKKGFIRVPGCLDMAVQGATLYVDNATDLVAIDLSNPDAPKVVSRVPDMFPPLESPDGRRLEQQYTEEKRPANTVIVDWVRIN